jgi:hypothetical protein
MNARREMTKRLNDPIQRRMFAVALLKTAYFKSAAKEILIKRIAQKRLERLQAKKPFPHRSQDQHP